ncbi:MAG: citrate transporter [Clostridia bacterium]|nr:citrate transporter [Clostridia bacterium]
MSTFKGFVKRNPVVCIALFAALVTVLFVPVDIQYTEYFDFKTLTCLFCTLAVITALKNINFFSVIARKIVVACHTLRLTVIALVYITFIGSMLIANDMALITFLPLGFFVLDSTNNRHMMAFTFIMQNIAANLGGMLTPFGNPQNLYMYSYFNIPDAEFVNIMFLPFLVSIVIITLLCMIFVKNEPLVLKDDDKTALPPLKTAIYLLLFAFSIAIVFRGIPYYCGLILIPLVLLIMDRNALKKVDYPLLITFCAFFVFSGNLARIDAVNELISSLMSKNTLLCGVLSCQVISNVPSAILLSKFTTNYPALLVAVNIGGTGTLIASLASLITFREYNKNNPGKALHYVGKFSMFNFGMLAVLTAMMYLVLC